MSDEQQNQVVQEKIEEIKEEEKEEVKYEITSPKDFVRNLRKTGATDPRGYIKSFKEMWDFKWIFSKWYEKLIFILLFLNGVWRLYEFFVWTLG